MVAPHTRDRAAAGPAVGTAFDVDKADGYVRWAAAMAERGIRLVRSCPTDRAGARELRGAYSPANRPKPRKPRRLNADDTP